MPFNDSGLRALGVNAKNPPDMTWHTVDPTPNDYIMFDIGHLWYVDYQTTPATFALWYLASKAGLMATWLKLLGGAGGNAITNLIDDSGNIIVPLLGAITIQGGANINTDGSVPHIITVNLDTSILQPATTADQSAGVYSVGGAPFMHAYGVSNVWLGDAGNFTLTTANAASNVGIGFYALSSLVGSGPTLGDANVGIGYNSLHSLTDGGNNVAIGFASAPFITTGSSNVILGQQAGQTYVGDESDNICIGHEAIGVVGETNTLHIGKVTGNATGDGQLKAAYICGIYNTAAGIAYLGTNPKMVAIGSDNKITSSPNIYMPATTATEGQVIQGSMPILHAYGTNNVFIGQAAGNFTFNTIFNNGNIGIGNLTLETLMGTAGFEGCFNVAVGQYALRFITTGTGNTALGGSAGMNLTTGEANFFIGSNAGMFLTTGSDNTLVGQGSGTNYTGNESENIIIGNDTLGVTGESNVLRIGQATGSGLAKLNKAFIQGIRGIITVNANAIPVLIDSVGQLGTVSSSIRHKENVKDISDMSEIISKLRPVEFNYKQHKPTDKQYGLIAEEVAPVWPEMLVYDKEGQPETLKYQYLPIILLKEIQKLTKRIEELEHTCVGKHT